jgi:hypothetical protein
MWQYSLLRHRCPAEQGITATFSRLHIITRPNDTFVPATHHMFEEVRALCLHPLGASRISSHRVRNIFLRSASSSDPQKWRRKGQAEWWMGKTFPADCILFLKIPGPWSNIECTPLWHPMEAILTKQILGHNFFLKSNTRVAGTSGPFAIWRNGCFVRRSFCWTRVEVMKTNVSHLLNDPRALTRWR